MTVATTVSFGEPAVVAAVDGRDGDDLVTVDEPAVGVDREHTVRVAVEGEPRVGPALDHGLLQVLRVGGPAAGVDVRAVGLIVDDLHRRPEGPQHLGGDRGGGTVGAVDHQRHPLEATAVDRSQHRVGPAAHRLGPVDDRARPRRPCRAEPARWWARSACSSASSAVSTSSVSLRPPGANSLIAVVLEPVVRRGDHRAGRALGGRQPRHRRRRRHPERRDLHPFGGEPGDQRRLQQRSRQAGVAARRRTAAAQHPCGGATRAPAPAPASDPGWRRPRTPSVPNLSTHEACQSTPAEPSR